MADALKGYPSGAKAQAETAAIVGLIEEANRRACVMASVWHDVEWHHSGDVGEDTVEETLKKYNEEAK